MRRNGPSRPTSVESGRAGAAARSAETTSLGSPSIRWRSNGGVGDEPRGERHHRVDAVHCDHGGGVDVAVPALVGQAPAQHYMEVGVGDVGDIGGIGLQRRIGGRPVEREGISQADDFFSSGNMRSASTSFSRKPVMAAITPSTSPHSQ